jgi:Cdc6-like AAA superfamily ATPase
MDLAERIARRRTRRTEDRLVVDWDALNPAVHLPEPIGREAVFEALLDALDPLFDGALPGNVYVWGPGGSGKSAIVSVLMSTLAQELSSQRPLYTATRGESGLAEARFVYLDARQASSEFRLYRQLLDELRTEAVPERGVSTDGLFEGIEAELATARGALVAVDHLGEPASVALEALHGFLEPFDDVAWLGIGRTPPRELPFPIPETQVHVPAYSYELVNVLTVRGTRGLSRTLDHVHAQRIAEWADGDAHDALVALFVAALSAEADGETHLRDADVEAGMESVPDDGVPIGRVLALSDTEQHVLRALLQLPAEADRSIDATAERIADRAGTDLTSATVKRLLYELAQSGVLERRAVPSGREVVGRQPSMVTPNFPVTLFEHLSEP